MLQELCLYLNGIYEQGRLASKSGLTNDGLQAKMPRRYRHLPCGETFFAQWQNLDESLIRRNNRRANSDGAKVT